MKRGKNAAQNLGAKILGSLDEHIVLRTSAELMLGERIPVERVLLEALCLQQTFKEAHPPAATIRRAMQSVATAYEAYFQYRMKNHQRYESHPVESRHETSHVKILSRGLRSSEQLVAKIRQVLAELLRRTHEEPVPTALQRLSDYIELLVADYVTEFHEHLNALNEGPEVIQMRGALAALVSEAAPRYMHLESKHQLRRYFHRAVSYQILALEPGGGAKSGRWFQWARQLFERARRRWQTRPTEVEHRLVFQNEAGQIFEIGTMADSVSQTETAEGVLIHVQRHFLPEVSRQAANIGLWHVTSNLEFNLGDWNLSGAAPRVTINAVSKIENLGHHGSFQATVVLSKGEILQVIDHQKNSKSQDFPEMVEPVWETNRESLRLS